MSTETRVKLQFNAIMSKHVKAFPIHQDQFECAFEVGMDDINPHINKLKHWLLKHIPLAEVCRLTLKYEQHMFTHSHHIRAEDEPTEEEESDLEFEYEGYGGEYHVIQTIYWKIEYSSLIPCGFCIRQHFSEPKDTEIPYPTSTDDVVCGLARNICTPSYIEPLQVVTYTQRDRRARRAKLFPLCD